MTAVTLTRGALRTRRIVAGWLLLGLAAYVLLPWYFPQNLSLWRALPGVFGGADTASGLVQAWQHGGPGSGSGWPVWPWRPRAGASRPAACKAGCWCGGALLGLAGLLAQRLHDRRHRLVLRDAEWLVRRAAARPVRRRPRRRAGAAALLMLLGAGIARLGYFRGDLFVAGAVVFC
jgi:iron(III) transport system permease protein